MAFDHAFYVGAALQCVDVLGVVAEEFFVFFQEFYEPKGKKKLLFVPHLKGMIVSNWFLVFSLVMIMDTKKYFYKCNYFIGNYN